WRGTASIGSDPNHPIPKRRRLGQEMIDKKVFRKDLSVRFSLARLKNMTMVGTTGLNEPALPTAAATGGELAKKNLHCCLCFKSQQEVRRLIGGLAVVYICDEGVELCNNIIAGPPRGPAKTASIKELPTERLLERLQPIEDTIQGRGNQLQQVVD